MAYNTDYIVTEVPLVIRKIGPADLKDALNKGWADFMAHPTHLVFLFVIYPVVVFFSFKAATGQALMPMLFPLAAGYALIGPFAAVGLYKISQRRELGYDTSSEHDSDVFLHSRSIRSIAILGALQMVIFLVWLTTARAIYGSIVGIAPESIGQFLQLVFATPAGLVLILVGIGVGFLFAVVALTVGVISFPLLIDRDVGAMVALQTSVRAVLANPVSMALWGFIVAFLLVLGSLPLFVGHCVVMPVLGHATWHVYRRIIEPVPVDQI